MVRDISSPPKHLAQFNANDREKTNLRRGIDALIKPQVDALLKAGYKAACVQRSLREKYRLDKEILQIIPTIRQIYYRKASAFPKASRRIRTNRITNAATCAASTGEDAEVNPHGLLQSPEITDPQEPDSEPKSSEHTGSKKFTVVQIFNSLAAAIEFKNGFEGNIFVESNSSDIGADCVAREYICQSHSGCSRLVRIVSHPIAATFELCPDTTHFQLCKGSRHTRGIHPVLYAEVDGLLKDGGTPAIVRRDLLRRYQLDSKMQEIIPTYIQLANRKACLGRKRGLAPSNKKEVAQEDISHEHNYPWRGKLIADFQAFTYVKSFTSFEAAVEFKNHFEGGNFQLNAAAGATKPHLQEYICHSHKDCKRLVRIHSTSTEHTFLASTQTTHYQPSTGAKRTKEATALACYALPTLLKQKYMFDDTMKRNIPSVQRIKQRVEDLGLGLNEDEAMSHLKAGEALSRPGISNVLSPGDIANVEEDTHTENDDLADCTSKEFMQIDDSRSTNKSLRSSCHSSSCRGDYDNSVNRDGDGLKESKVDAATRKLNFTFVKSFPTLEAAQEFLHSFDDCCYSRATLEGGLDCQLREYTCMLHEDCFRMVRIISTSIAHRFEVCDEIQPTPPYASTTRSHARSSIYPMLQREMELVARGPPRKVLLQKDSQDSKIGHAISNSRQIATQRAQVHQKFEPARDLRDPSSAFRHRRQPESIISFTSEAAPPHPSTIYLPPEMSGESTHELHTTSDEFFRSKKSPSLPTSRVFQGCVDNGSHSEGMFTAEPLLAGNLASTNDPEFGSSGNTEASIVLWANSKISLN